MQILVALDVNGAMLIAGTAIVLVLCLIAGLPRGRSKLQFQSTKGEAAAKRH